MFYVVFLFVLQLAFGVFDPNPIDDLLEGIIAFLPKVFVAISSIVVITAAVATAVKTLVESVLGGLSYGRTLAMVASAAIWVVGITAALNQVESHRRSSTVSSTRCSRCWSAWALSRSEAEESSRCVSVGNGR